jgi:MFS family permease
MTTGRPRLGVMAQYALPAGPLLAMLDSSIVNVAGEPIARELRTSLTTVQWAVSGYLLAIGAGLAATSYLARRYGTLPLYRASVIAFTLASAACALAPNVEALLVARAIQGLVGAPMVPLVMTMMLGGGDTTREISPLAGILLFLGSALGPRVGGALIGATGCEASSSSTFRSAGWRCSPRRAFPWPSLPAVPPVRGSICPGSCS